jgi:hypothetical protein
MIFSSLESTKTLKKTPNAEERTSRSLTHDEDTDPRWNRNTFLQGKCRLFLFFARPKPGLGKFWVCFSFIERAKTPCFQALTERPHARAM